MSADLRFAVVCSIRDEGPFLLEWIAWQRMLGFTDIIVVSNDCSDASPALLDALQRAGWITHLRHDVPDGTAVCARKLQAAKRLRRIARADWLMVCDIDEFLVVHVDGGGIADLIASVAAPFLGMAINWRVYGASGIETFEDRPVHQQFLRAGPLRSAGSRWIKCIHAQPKWFGALGEHGPRRLDLARARAKTGAGWGEGGLRWVNSAGETLESWQPEGPYLRMLPAAETSHAAAQINHYMVKSAESFSLKRGTASAVAGVDRYTDLYLSRFDRNECEDPSALAYAGRFAPLWAEAMALPDVARLHHQCCADHLARIAGRAGRHAAEDPRYRHHLSLAGKAPGAADAVGDNAAGDNVAR